MKAYREEPSTAMKERRWALTLCCWQDCSSIVHAHWHEAYEVLYIRRGSIEEIINGKRYTADAGDVVVVAPYDIHSTASLSEDGCDIDVLQFTAGYLGSERLQSGVVRPEEPVAALYAYLWRIKENRRPGSKLLTSGLVQTLCGLLRPYSGPSATACSPEIEAVCDYLNGAQDLRLQQTAARFNYSPEHLSRKFRSEMGIPYRRYCEQVRMRRAILLLSDETADLPAVAELLGYSDSSCFIRAFRQVYGITPGAYRRRRRGLDA